MINLELPVRYVFESSRALRPLNGSICLTDDRCDFTWQSNDQSPSFLLAKRPMLSGWYMVEVNVRANKEYLDASLTFDDSTSKGRSNTHPLLLISKRTIKRIVYVSSSVKDIRFSPAEEKVMFSIECLRFVKLTQRLALKLMQKKLRTYNPDINYRRSLHLWRHYSTFFKQQQKSETEYSTWIEKREPALLEKAVHINQNIKFTAILYFDENTALKEYNATLKSLLQQSYHNWDVVAIINSRDHTFHLSVRDLFSNFCKKVSFVIRASSQRLAVSEITQDLNSSYYLSLTSDIVLSKYAISIYARNINNSNAPEILYSDDDVIDEKGVRNCPRFKPDLNPDLLLSKNYIGESIVLHSKLLKEATATSIDKYYIWIFSILVIRGLAKANIKHIPLILNHRKNKTINNKIEKTKHQLSFLKNYLTPLHAKASHGKKIGVFRITWTVQGNEPLVTIIIPTRDGLEILKRAVDSIIKTTRYSNYEILIVDNQSREQKTLNYFQKISTNNRIRILSYNKPFNYSALNNYAVKQANGSVLALLNNDVEIISSSWLTEMVGHTQRSDIGCVGAMLYYPDNRIQHAGVIIGLGGCAGHSHKFYNRGASGYTDRLLCTQNYSAVTAACLVVKKQIFNDVGGLNQKDLAVAFNDVDFCLKVQALGYRNLWTPWAELYHHESVSRGEDNTRIKRKRLTSEVNYMREIWKTSKTLDPNYSKFLTRIREDFSFGL